MKQFQNSLHPLKKKLGLENFIQVLLSFISVGSGVALVLVVLSKILFFPEVWKVVIGILLLSFFMAIGYWCYKPISWKKVAQVADGLGGKEVMITTLELLEREKLNEVEQIVVEKAFHISKEIDFLKIYKIKIPEKTVKVLGLFSYYGSWFFTIT